MMPRDPADARRGAAADPQGAMMSDPPPRPASLQAQLARDMDDPWFWHKLVPELTLRETAPILPNEPIDPIQCERARDRLEGDGFATVRAGITPRPQLLAGIRRILASGLPPAFIFMYDEPWHHLGRLRATIAEVLGAPYYFDPAIWTWHVPLGPAYAGWAPHRDCSRIEAVDADGRPRGLGVWIPLTPATPDNGCMYVVPARYAGEDLASCNLRDAHALPAEPGDVLFWRMDVWHWGGRSTEFAETPRTSIGVEIFRTDVEPPATPTLDPEAIPPFKLRLALIGANLLKYHRDRSWTPLGERLMAIDNEVASGRRK